MQLINLTFSLLALLTHSSHAIPAAEPLNDEAFYKLELPKRTPNGLNIVDLRFKSDLDKRAGCGNIPGTANGECVDYYSGPDCAGQDHIKGYKPTCAGNCYVDKFYSVKVSGDGTYSTNCDLYSDTSCQNKIASVGSKTGFGSCSRNANGWSMKCYYRC
ncbi:hypothetical protein QQS21_002335 [Conoideocrella luteorostrata]|uniref:Secreted protein n=1 Tax=Conoideocrella luteorostrata TaxID=1105319 RepID=A0AAJ0FXD7_9HYPO|nr:hypothetical protein QQS21_002335 [Conoideocrella luteorostrata]